MKNTLDHIKSKFTADTANPVQIPDVSRLDLVRWFRELDFKVGAEIGVAQGELSKIICEINPQLKLYGVDAWRSYTGYTDYVRSSTFEAMRNQTLERMNPYIKRGRFEVVEKFSMDALNDFEDGSLDFVYIDANHEAPFVNQDIQGWSKKVKPGGIVAGHDYARIKRVEWGVIEAIHGHVKTHNIDPWFVLGTDEVVPGQVREGARTWMYVVPE
jgi:SAM-dependent methyltransferase